MRPRQLRLSGAFAVAVASIALAACGGDGSSEDSGGGGAQSSGGTDENLPEVAVQTQNGFNAQEVYAESSPSVVTVSSVFGDPEDADALAGQGSGFVLGDGEIVTNAHVVTDGGQAGGGAGGGRDSADINPADEVFVEFSDRNQVPAEIVGFDPNADVALLEFDPKGLDEEPLELADSSKVEVGTPVAAIGSPFGQDRSLSTGIISATNRAIESLTQFRIDGGIQTDASINPGNSGGPLINGAGEVIGINQQINTTDGGFDGVGFAVPANLVKRSVDDLREDGEVSYAFIGVTTQALYPQLASELDIDAPTGALISEVVPDGPADKAGLQGAGDQTVNFQGRQIDVGGDAIVAIDGTELVTETDLSRLIAEKRPGDKVDVEIIRDGDKKTVEVTLEERPTSVPNPDDGG